MGEQIRSGRSTRRDGPSTATADAAPAGEPADEVVVVGRGPIASAVAAAWGEHVRTVDELPAESPQDAIAGATVVVLVAHPGDLVASPVKGRRERETAVVAHTQRVLGAARAVGARHVVAIGSAVVHGAWADRPVIHDVDPLPRADESVREGLVGDLLAAEAVLERARRRKAPLVTVLRPAAVVGVGIDTFVTRHFEAPRLLTVRGAVRQWQFVHVEDLAAAARFAVAHRLAGVLTVGADDVLEPAQVEAAAGMRRVELAAATAFGTAERLHRVGVLPAPASELAFVVYPWTVAADRLREAGWAPRWSSAACLDVLLEGVQGRVAVAGRRVGTRDAAALGAAGAAVALIGTAAVWRQARARRRP
ncbi:nucleoside-diphosphate-sugar epimerase [Cellulomonas humilata]|uniref:Nucleoside-diphosphate-sugar epimerase n=1 Tax=Cellulomonas humilata TaxID=144055 RepID=A0ABU0EDH5_9CELL|nr:nucleoside-diphosphate-sugar epimerase [Cellulomonas humilata]